MGEGWTRWVLEQYGFSYVTIRPEDFKSPLADKIDVLIIADDARVPIAPGAGRRRRRHRQAQAAAAVAARSGPSTRINCDASDLQGFEQFVRGGGTVVCLSNASAFAIQQLRLPVQERRRRPEAGRVLPARIDRRGDDRCRRTR